MFSILLIACVAEATLTEEIEGLVGAASDLDSLSLSEFVILMVGILSTCWPSRITRGQSTRVNSRRVRNIGLYDRLANTLMAIFSPKWGSSFMHTVISALNTQGILHSMRDGCRHMLARIQWVTNFANSNVLHSIILEYPHERCAHQQCANAALMRRGMHRVRVVTLFGMRYAMHRAKYCRRCHRQYFYNYCATPVPGSTRRQAVWYPISHDTPHAFFPGRSFNFFIHRAVLEWMDAELYFCHSSFRGMSKTWNAFWGSKSSLSMRQDRFINSNGRDLSSAWKRYRLLRYHHRLGAQTPWIHDMEASLESLMKEANLSYRANGLREREHHCDDIGCWKVDASREHWDAIVVDGIQSISGSQCSHPACHSAPISSRRRFCQVHQHLETMCAARDASTDLQCTNNALPGRQCCSAHQAVERRYGGSLESHRWFPRSTGETQASWQQRNHRWFTERAKHFFSRAKTYGYWFACRPCGMILGIRPMWRHESDEDLVTWLDGSICPIGGMRPPRYMIFDRACRTVRCFGPGCLLHHLCVRWWMPMVEWVVDRFHFMGHARSDMVCRKFCGPNEPTHTGLVQILYENVVPGPDQTRASGPLGEFIGAWVHPITQQQYKKVRRMRRSVPTGNASSQLAWKDYFVLFICNTEVCEETFANMGHFSRMVKSMTGPFGEFFMYQMCELHNSAVTGKLERKGLNPSIPEDIGPFPPIETMQWPLSQGLPTD